jgi:hypothetical protein
MDPHASVLERVEALLRRSLDMDGVVDLEGVVLDAEGMLDVTGPSCLARIDAIPWNLVYMISASATIDPGGQEMKDVAARKRVTIVETRPKVRDEWRVWLLDDGDLRLVPRGSDSDDRWSL